MDLRQPAQRRTPVGGAKVTGVRHQVRLGLLHLLERIGQDLVRRLRQAVPLAQQEIQRLGAAGRRRDRGGAQLVRQVAFVACKGSQRRIGRPPQLRLQRRSRRGFLGGEDVDPRPEKCPGARTLAQRPLRPRRRRPPHVFTALRQQPLDRVHARTRRLRPLGKGRIVRQKEPDGAKDRLARVQRGVAALEVVRAKLPLLDAQKALGQPLVDPLDRRQRALVDLPCLAQQRFRICQRRRHALRREVRQLRVVVVLADKGGVDRPVAVVRRKEAPEPRPELAARPGVHPGTHLASPSSGSRTHRSSWNERSTALIVSCTHAPSSKLPWLRSPPSRISSIKSRIRLA